MAKGDEEGKGGEDFRLKGLSVPIGERGKGFLSVEGKGLGCR